MTGYRYQQLENWLLEGINNKRWRAGERLPSIRQLCEEQQLSKATVQHALQRLEAQGLIEVRPKSGFFVSQPKINTAQPVSRIRVAAPHLVNSSELLLDIMQRGAAFDLLPSMEHGEKSTGITGLNRSIGRALRRQKGTTHQYYDDPAGDHQFREQLSLHYSRRGWPVSEDQLVITSGCQNALFLALMATCQPGDVVAVESPGFYGTLQLLEQLHLKVLEIPSSSETGVDVDTFSEMLSKWPVKACIVSPAFATPGGALMPAADRVQLLELAERYDLAVIEDDIYGDLSFSAVPDPLKALDQNDRVILCSSFSKSLSRDLRLGWISGARWHNRIKQLKLVTQLASSRYLQQGVAEYMADGQLASHLRRYREQLRLQRDQLIYQLQSWPDEIRYSVPKGGLALWLELPQRVDTLNGYSQLLAQGIVITPGSLFSTSDQFRNCLRLSYAHPWDNERSWALAAIREKLLG